MSTPTPEAYEAACAALDRWYDRAGFGSHEGTRITRPIVDAVWPIAVAATRAQVAAEIRAATQAVAIGPGGEDPADCWSVGEWAARIAEGGTP